MIKSPFQSRDSIISFVHENIGGIFKTDCKINLFDKGSSTPSEQFPEGTAFLLLSLDDPIYTSQPPKFYGVPILPDYGIYPIQINILIADKVINLDLYTNGFSNIFKGY